MAAFLRRRLRGIAAAWTAPCGPAKPLLALARRRGHHRPNKTRHGVPEGGVPVKEARMFFFEKKNQKTFIRLHPRQTNETGAGIKSLFASFSSEKEDLLFWLSP